MLMLIHNDFPEGKWSNGPINQKGFLNNLATLNLFLLMA